MDLYTAISKYYNVSREYVKHNILGFIYGRAFRKLLKFMESPCCDSPSQEKCDQCQEVGLANPLNRG